MNVGVRELIDRLTTEREPEASSLGTPVPAGSPAVRALVALGSDAVDELLAAARTSRGRTLAYVVMILGEIGDPRALPFLRELRDRYASMPDKGEWDYAVLGRANVAIGALERNEPC